ncbi:MAG: glycosyltransferase family 2 protein [Hyphomicrobiales bacterium]
MQSKPLVTVAITAFEREALFDICLKSIAAQTYRELEIFVFDNSSSDAVENCVEKLADSRVTYSRNPANISANFALNHQKAFTPQNGKYHMVLSSDWALREDAIEKMVRRLESDPSISVVKSNDSWRDPETGEEGLRKVKFEKFEYQGEHGPLIDPKALIYDAYTHLAGVGVNYHVLIVSDILRFSDLEKVYYNQGYEHQAGLELLLMQDAFGMIREPLFIELMNPNRYVEGGYRKYGRFSEAVARVRFFEKNYPELVARDFNLTRLRAGIVYHFFRCIFRPSQKPVEAMVYSLKYAVPLAGALVLWPIYALIGIPVSLIEKALGGRKSQ